MKQTWIKLTAFAFAVALLVPASLLAQDEKEKEAKELKETKEGKEKKDVQQIIITRKNDTGEKVIVEINGDKITINGKPLDEYKDKDGDVSVRIQKIKDLEGLLRSTKSGTWNYSGNDSYNVFNANANQAMLGVTTEKVETGGVKIQDITKEGGAEKAGLKEGDVITKIDDKKIEDPDDLSKAIKSHKPGDKVTVSYLRDKKEEKVTAELTKWKGQEYNLKMDMGNLNFDKAMPRTLTVPRAYAPYGQNLFLSGGTPKLGLSVQDADDGKGVKVIEVDEESNSAKAGVKENDIITEVDGKVINGTDDMVKIIKESKDKASVMIKLQRSGKTQNIEVKMPHKIKKADL